MRQRAQERLFSSLYPVIAILLATILLFAAAIALWRPVEAKNDPYRERIADWTITGTANASAFVGYGIFTYRPDWSGPAQSFNGPVLLHVEDTDAPVRVRLTGGYTLSQDTPAELSVSDEQTAGTVSDLTLDAGDTVSLSPQTSFAVTTGAGEASRLFAVAVLPDGPPSTPGIEQVEWRSWGEAALPATPFTVSVADLQLAGGETYAFTRPTGPELLAIEGIGTGSTSIGVTIAAGSGVYQKVGSSAPWELASPYALQASGTSFTPARERFLEVGSGAFLAQGVSARIRNGSLVDGTAVRMIAIGAS